MTSQMVLITQAGIGIASDTMTSWGARGGGPKTSPTANKIYELGPNHKVVVVHSGATSVAGLSYELLVREWALTQTAPLPALENYPQAFENWLANYRRLPIDEVDAVGERVWGGLHDFVRDFLRDEAEVWVPLTALAEGAAPDPDLDAAICHQLTRFAKYAQDDDPGPLRTAPEAQLRARFHGDTSVDPCKVFTNVIEHFIGTTLDFTSDTLRAALEEASIQWLRYLNPISGRAQLHWVGFGTDEPIGGLITMRINGYYLGRLQAITDTRQPDTTTTIPWILPLAQRDAIEDFIGGIGPRLHHIVMDIIDSTFGHLTDPKDVESSKEFVGKFKESFNEQLGEASWALYVMPLRETLSALSLASLVGLCEALVNLQRLRSYMSNEEATVGGIIESMSISRSHGVKWRNQLHGGGLGGAVGATHSPHPLL